MPSSVAIMGDKHKTDSIGHLSYTQVILQNKTHRQLTVTYALSLARSLQHVWAKGTTKTK